MNICVYGASSRTIDEKYIRATEELGKALAERGHGLVFGGGAGGLMGAVARGFEKGGAKEIICVAPKFFNVDGILFERCSEYIYPDTMRERKAIMEEKAHAFVAAPGGIGTFDEFFEIITLRSLGRHTKPVALYNAHGFYKPMLAMLKEYESQGFLKLSDELFFVSDSPDKIAKFIENTKTETLDVHKFKNI